MLTNEAVPDTRAPQEPPPASPADYRRVERAIRFLAEDFQSQPSLDAVAGRVGLSPFHFQRLFRRWAGVSPKRFVQYLTAEHAKALLRRSASVLDAAWGAGLSGPGRLHDLVVAVEAVTPGELKRGGEGLEIRYGFHATPFGECLVAVTGRGVCALSFVAGDGRAAAKRELQQAWPGATLVEDAEASAPVVMAVFARRGRGERRLRLLLKGTNLQLKVWSALLRLPEGTAVTYADVARAVGQPRAARAVGTALGQNPIGVLIPCHRVLRSTGAFGGYRWGEARKRALLAWEAARTEASAG
jgi:AraC family transcriptional regulator of adaptative response/methylated-DNA-[protein]-cysteine methyltransferase